MARLTEHGHASPSAYLHNEEITAFNAKEVVSVLSQAWEKCTDPMSLLSLLQDWKPVGAFVCLSGSGGQSGGPRG